MYIAKNERLRNYLYSIGFNYTTLKDLKDETKEVYGFKDSELLREAITFYSNLRKKVYNK